MKSILTDIANAIQYIPLTKETIELNPVFDISELIKTKRTITISADKHDLMKAHYKSNTRKQMKQVRPSINYQYIYTDPYGQAEYFTSLDCFRFSNEVAKQIKKHPEQSVTVNAYGLENYLFDDGLFEKESLADVPKTLSIKLPKKGIMTTFSEKVMKTINSQLSIMTVNIPYEYYKTIYRVDNLFYYDLDTNNFAATGTSKEDIISMIQNIAEEGIREPLCMQVNNGRIVSTKDCYSRLLCALYLRLPYIPVVLYISLQQVDPLEELIPIPTEENKELLNELAAPYFHWL